MTAPVRLVIRRIDKTNRSLTRRQFLFRKNFFLQAEMAEKNPGVADTPRVYETTGTLLVMNSPSIFSGQRPERDARARCRVEWKTAIMNLVSVRNEPIRERPMKCNCSRTMSSQFSMLHHFAQLDLFKVDWEFHHVSSLQWLYSIRTGEVLAVLTMRPSMTNRQADK